MRRRIPAFAAAIALTLPAHAVPAAAAPGVTLAPAEVGVTLEAAGRCPQINIGTPERPRYVKDPACGSGRG